MNTLRKIFVFTVLVCISLALWGQKSFNDWKIEAEAGSAEAQYKLGAFYVSGVQGVPIDNVEAVKWLRKSADQNYAGAQYLLGLCYEEGTGVNLDYTQAVYWLEKAAEQNHAKAAYSLGLMYNNGEGIIQSYTEAIKWYMKAAEQGHTNAMNNIGSKYFNGQGVEQNFAEAEKWFIKALSVEKLQIALDNITLLYKQRGYAASKFNEELKEKYENEDVNLESLRASTNPEDMFHLGVIYQLGFNGVSQDLSEAKKWYEAAARKKNADAQNALGNMYYLGIGTEKNYNEAAQLYKKAKKKNKYAQYSLGLMYYFGDARAKLPILYAVSEWARIPKEYQVASASYYLLANSYSTDDVYINNPDLYKSPHNSLTYFRKSAELGNVAAKYRLEELLADQQINPDKYKGLTMADFIPLVTSTATLAGQISDLSNNKSGNNSSASNNTSSSGSANRSTNKKENSGSKNTKSEKTCGQAWSTDAQTYSTYETYLIRLNSGTYTSDDDRERRDWQQKMRTIRNKWVKQGCPISKSEWEDWDGVQR
ncbi:MAG: sel1 repeat family protein [Prevotellaceae bacterium]|jgi:TPR repeat protein|nr:sel1 repeat family protein [Prevotellaceae bacterium]